MVEWIPEVREEVLYCPRCRFPILHYWVGWFHVYSQWECSVCKRVILGPPYRAPY